MRENTAALDIGLKRIGLALCLDGQTVLPQSAIMRRSRKQAAKETSEFVKEWDIGTLVVGIPRGGGSEEEMERRIRHFVSLLELPPDIRICYQDEANSSAEAKEQMRGEIRQVRDGRIDSLAAKIILERWLEKSA